jgi:hypothetical protein
MLRSGCAWFITILLGSFVAGCDPGGPDDVAATAQDIMNGTWEPTLVNLSAGQQLAIGFLSRGTGDPFCTGTVIAPGVVLTALHCIKDANLSEIRFGVGLPRSPRGRFEVYRAAQADWEYDIALLQLRQNAVTAVPELVPLSFNRRPLDFSVVGRRAEASGYHLIGGEEPRRRFGVLEITNLLEKALVANGNGVRGVCNGDSGGPLLLELDPGQPVIVGTTEGGNMSCLNDSYFSRPDVLVDWIDAQMQAFAASPPPSSGRRRPDCTNAELGGTWPVFGAIVAVGPLRRRRRSQSA